MQKDRYIIVSHHDSHLEAVVQDQRHTINGLIFQYHQGKAACFTATEKDLAMFAEVPGYSFYFSDGTFKAASETYKVAPAYNAGFEQRLANGTLTEQDMIMLGRFGFNRGTPTSNTKSQPLIQTTTGHQVTLKDEEELTPVPVIPPSEPQFSPTETDALSTNVSHFNLTTVELKDPTQSTAPADLDPQPTPNDPQSPPKDPMQDPAYKDAFESLEGVIKSELQGKAKDLGITGWNGNTSVAVLRDLIAKTLSNYQQ